VGVRKKLSNDLVPIHPDNVSNKDWVILLEVGTILGPSVWTGRALQAESDDLEKVGLALLYPAYRWSL